MSLLHPDRLFSSNERERAIARTLFDTVKDLPIVSPHGHTDPRWFADNEAFPDPAALLIQPDHYLLRMLYSRGVSLEEMGIRPCGEETEAPDGEVVWARFADHYHLFQGTPTSLWFEHALSTVFDIQESCPRRMRRTSTPAFKIVWGAMIFAHAPSLTGST